MSVIGVHAMYRIWANGGLEIVVPGLCMPTFWQVGPGTNDAGRILMKL